MLIGNERNFAVDKNQDKMYTLFVEMYVSEMRLKT